MSDSSRVSLLAFVLSSFSLAGCSGFVTGNNGSPPPATLAITNIVAASTTTSTCQVDWTTNLPADSAVDYGTTTSYGSTTPVDQAMVTSHQIALSGLAPGTAYYYQVRSTDSKSNSVHSGGHSFKTSGSAPSITTQPASQTVTAGQTASFSVTATGTSPLSYQWNKNGAAISGATSPSYTTPAETTSDNGAQFSVVVSNVAGSATSSSATLTVSAAPVAPSITTQPASQTVTAGQTATFSVAAMGTAPLTYQWMKNGAAMSGTNSSSYTTPSTTSSDNGAQFSVMVSNSAGSATSSSATLTVSAAPVAPSITTQPASQTVTAGQTATFSVAAMGTGPLTYQWMKNGAAMSGATSPSYITSPTTSSDNGALFSVMVSNGAGSVTSNAATLTVNAAQVAPSITTQPASQTVSAGQTASFTVAATGTSPLNYQWNKNGAAISGATSSSYTTPAETTSDNGAQFSVVVSNVAGSATSSAATLTVNAVSTPQITTSQLPGGFVAGGYSSTLTATGGSTPYTWSMVSGALPNGLTLNTSGTISGTPSLAGSFPFTVQVKDASSQSASRNFSINVASPTPTVAITSPTSGSTVAGTISVSGTASDSVAINSVQVAVDGGSYSNASGTNNWSFSLNTSSLSNGPHTLTAKVTDAAGSTATSSSLGITVNNGSLATDCTLYGSSSGNDNNSGTSPTSPKTFTGAASATRPGSVVCLLGGTYQMSNTFYPPTSGTPSSWIVYKNYGDGPVNFVWITGALQSMFQFGNGTFPSNPAYLEFNGLNLDGLNNALNGFFCVGAHHLRFIGNTINNTAGSGVGAVQCDYLTSDHNLINHNGYLWGWTSGISYNNNVWFDSYPGFHNIIANNIVVGEFDGSTHHTDGNGIILDLGGNTPPALIINNVVYGNGGRCIQSLNNINFWIVNNTCYKNNLDPSLGNAGSFTSQNSSNGYFINNIAVAWHTNNPSYDQEGSNSNISYYADMYFGSSPNFIPADPTQLIQADPLFVNPPYFDPTALGQYATALAPSLLGNGLTLLPLSPAYNKGIDASTLSGVPSAIVSDLKKYIYTDINGKARPQGGGSDLGAYQH